MAGRAAFNGVFAAGQGNLDRIRDAACDLLDADPELAAWMNSGKVIRSVLYDLPGTPTPPWVMVGALAVRYSTAPGSRGKYEVPLGIMVGFEEFVEEYEPGDVTPATLYDIIGGILFTGTNPYLRVPRFGMVPLTQRLDGIAPVDISRAKTAQGSVITITFEATYFLQADIFSPRTLRLPA